MWKLPRGHKKHHGGWKKRYFVLVNDGLHYYEDLQAQFESTYLADLAVNSPGYKGSFSIHTHTRIKQSASLLSENSACPKSIIIENQDNDIIHLHPEVPETVLGPCPILKQWVDALQAAVQYTHDLHRRQHNLVGTTSFRHLNAVCFSLVIGHQQPPSLETTDAQMSVGSCHHEKFNMALEETIGDLVRKIVMALDLKWIDNEPTILFRGSASAGKVRKVGFLGDEEDMALRPERTIREFVTWAGKQKYYECFIPPVTLDWTSMMPWEHSTAHTRRLLKHDYPFYLLESSDTELPMGASQMTLARPASFKKTHKRNPTHRRGRSRDRHSVDAATPALSMVLMLQPLQHLWHLRLEILKVLGLDPNRAKKCEQCEVECWKHKVNPLGEPSRDKVLEVNAKKVTQTVEDQVEPEFKKANRPERFDFYIPSPNITSLVITLKSGGRNVAKLNLEPLDIMCFASWTFYNQVAKHVELVTPHVLYEKAIYNELIPEKLGKNSASLGGDPKVANQVTTILHSFYFMAVVAQIIPICCCK